MKNRLIAETFLVIGILSPQAFADLPSTCPDIRSLHSAHIEYADALGEDFYTVKATVNNFNTEYSWELISDEVVAHSEKEAFQYARNAINNLLFISGPILRDSGITPGGDSWSLYDCNYRDIKGNRFYAVYDDYVYANK